MVKYEILFYTCLVVIGVALFQLVRANSKNWLPLVVLILVSLLLAILVAQFAQLDDIIFKLVKGV